MVSLARHDDSWRGCHSQPQPDPALLCMPLHPTRHEQGNGDPGPVQLVVQNKVCSNILSKLLILLFN